MNSPPPRLGIAFTPVLEPERLRSIAQSADASGLDDLWLWEDCFAESGIGPTAAALAWTERVHVCIGLLPVPLRNVAVAAMEIASLDRMFPGRFLVGIGHGVQVWMAQVGARVDSPLTLLREYTTALRSLLAGDEVSTSGRYVSLDQVQLRWPPSVPPVLALGGSGPKALALAGELGDVTLLGNALNVDEVATACRLTREAAGGQWRQHGVAATVIAATGPGAQERLDREIVRWGAAVGTGVGIAGSAEVIAESVLRYAQAGATSVVIQATEDEPDLDAFVALLGREVRPLLHR
ncbi:MAG TPA: LLM class flavin-dependent oxidoreductase [Propionibacteriaceae bacterium]|nr:LLM class flavin-dependent oxidoreductase [Propionibacteriaceae bacterium]